MITGAGFGLASCPSLGLLATSDDEYDTITVWSVPRDCGNGGLVHVCTLGGGFSTAPMQFKFSHSWASGYLAFTPANSRPLLLVTDACQGAVHIVDVVSQTHVGYVASPGSLAGSRGVAACETSPLVAVSVWNRYDSIDQRVVVFSGSGAQWESVRVIRGWHHPAQLRLPIGLRFSADGSCICVANTGSDRISLFRVSDGEYVRHTITRYPFDVVEVKGGWLVACQTKYHGFVHDDFHVECNSFAVATMPGLGVILRRPFYVEGTKGSQIMVFSNVDTMSMWTMSGMRVAWMTVVARGIMCCFRRR